jgi:hypothetical protein
MITYNKLGINGRLGNQMFQYGVLLGIHAKKGLEIVLNEKLSDSLELVKHFNITVPHFFNERDIRIGSTYKEEFFHYDRRLFNKVTDGFNIEGYFQSYKYFEHCEDLVREQFTFKPEILNQARTYIENVKKDRQVVTIHVRRTDYVNLPNHHPLCSVDYYNRAISHFNQDETTFIVCSDDINWCKENIKAKNIVYSTNNTFIDLCIMSLADHNIIANSSFSWWGSWLNINKDKKVITPSTWFGTYYFHYIMDDLYYPGMIKLKI